MKGKILVPVLCMMVLLLSGCASTKEKKQNILGVNGMIYDFSNKPVTDVQVLVNGKKSSISDINGHFSLVNITLGKTYAMEFVKPEYETVYFDFHFTDSSQIIYVSMASGKQLLDAAEKSLKQSEWKTASDFLERAEKAGAHATGVAYLRATLAYLRKEYSGAYVILDTLISSEIREPYIFLFAADLLQYHLDDPDTAIIRLEQFLDIQFDPDVQARLDELRKTTNHENR